MAPRFGVPDDARGNALRRVNPQTVDAPTHVHSQGRRARGRKSRVGSAPICVVGAHSRPLSCAHARRPRPPHRAQHLVVGVGLRGGGRPGSSAPSGPGLSPPRKVVSPAVSSKCWSKSEPWLQRGGPAFSFYPSLPRSPSPGRSRTVGHSPPALARFPQKRSPF